MAKPAKAPINCVRCAGQMYYLGIRDFHEGTRVGVFGDIFELFQNREEMEMFACGKCGRIEFFVGGVGEELRGWEPRKPRNWNPFHRGRKDTSDAGG